MNTSLDDGWAAVLVPHASFNDQTRGERLNVNWPLSKEEAKAKIEQWGRITARAVLIPPREAGCLVNSLDATRPHTRAGTLEKGLSLA